MRIYLAATNDLYDGRVSCTVNRLLLSYYSQTGKKLDVAVDAAGHPKDVCVDSGAHVFLAPYHKVGTKPGIEEIELHLHSMVSRIKLLPIRPSFVVELDLQDLYGVDVVSAWRRDIWIPLEKETGIRVAYVWHTPDGLDSWRKMVDNPDMHYLGLGGPKFLELGGRDLVVRAYAAKKPVHGFACVRRRLLTLVPFFSVDSTSWSASSLYGLIPGFNVKKGGAFSTAPVHHRSFSGVDFKESLGSVAIHGRGLVKIKDVTSGMGCTDSTYQLAANTYAEAERFFTAYWCARGFDWERQLT